MGRVMMGLWVLLALAVVVMGYIRLAPSDPVRWHVPLEFTADRDLKTGVMRVVETGPDGLERLDPIIRATPRTQLLTGSVEAGHVSYVTRSAVFGFPDYTTVQQAGDRLKIYGRLRFGGSDMGVNKTRVKGWLDALQP